MAGMLVWGILGGAVLGAAFGYVGAQKAMGTLLRVVRCQGFEIWSPRKWQSVP